MTEEKAKPKKAAAPKAPKAEAKKEATPKAAAPKAAPAKKAAKPTTVGAGQIRVKQVGSPIARHYSQRATLIGLGLNKLHRESILKDSPQVRGMINKVQHLVKVVG